MSKRFGRNQRRRLRTELAQGAIELAQNNAAWALDQQLIRWQRGVIDRQDGSLRDVATLLGEHFIGFEPRTVDMAEIPPEVRLAKREQLLRDISGTALCELTDMSVHHLGYQALECTRVRAALDELTMRTHVKVKTPLGEVAYAFSPGAFHGMPRPMAVRRLGQEITEHLLSSAALEGVL